jgi:hypothetical protein
MKRTKNVKQSTERLNVDSERDLLSKQDEILPDEIANIDARREAARQHADTYIVKTDLDDAEQREAAPGTREQP